MISDSASRSHDVDGHYPGKVVVPGARQRIRREFHVAGGRKQLVSCGAVRLATEFLSISAAAGQWNSSRILRDCSSCTYAPQYMAGIFVATGNEGENVRRREWRWRIRGTVAFVWSAARRLILLVLFLARSIH